MFHTQFVITERCNLSCKYCYMAHRGNDMSDDIFRDGWDFCTQKLKPIMGAPNQPTLITLFGGEPLLNLDLMKNNLDILRGEAVSIPTNFLLMTPEILDFLRSNNLGFSLSFDGDFGNTVNRIQADGEESFSKYNEFQMNLVRQHNPKVMLPPNTFPHLLEMYRWFLDEKIMMPDFTLVRDDIYQPKDIEIFRENLHELADYIITINKKGKFFSLPGLFSLYLLDTICYQKWGKRPFGCFAGVNGVGIMPDGKIYPCARFGSHQKLQIADLKTGEINHDNLKLMRSIYSPKEYEKCKRCKLYNVCNAGCSYSQMKNGGWEKMVPVESVCELLRISYHETYRVYKALRHLPQLQNYLRNALKNSG